MKNKVYVNNDEFNMIKVNNNETNEDCLTQFGHYLTYIGELVLRKLEGLNRIDECKEELGYTYKNDIINALVYSSEGKTLDGKQFMKALDESVPGIRNMYHEAIREVLNTDIAYQKQQITKEVIELAKSLEDGVALTVEDIKKLREEYSILLNVFIYDYMVEIVTKVGTFHLIKPQVKMPDVIVNKSTYFSNIDSHALSHFLAKKIDGDVVTGHVTGDLPNNILYRSWVLKDNMVYDVTTGYQMLQDEYYDLFEVEEVCKLNREELGKYETLIDVINNDTKEKKLMPYVTYQRILKENEKYKTLSKSF